MRIEAFIWDKHNIEKCQKHGLEISVIESFLLSDPFTILDDAHSELEPRYIAFGLFRERFMFVVFALRISEQRLKFRVVSARYAREKEIKRLREYEKTKGEFKVKKKSEY